MTTPRNAERGVILLVVLFFALLLASGVATFLRRSTVDAMISRNRDAAARAEALAHGGIRLGGALLLEDRLREAAGASLPLDTGQDPWAEGLDLELANGDRLRVRVEDTGSRLNLNSLFEVRRVKQEIGVRVVDGQIEVIPALAVAVAVDADFLERAVEFAPTVGNLGLGEV
jgi:type II secretory pathway component PulK